MSELDDILEANAQARAQARQEAEERAAEAADSIDQLAHPDESDEQREQRLAVEAERQRLRDLGVVLR